MKDQQVCVFLERVDEGILVKSDRYLAYYACLNCVSLLTRTLASAYLVLNHPHWCFAPLQGPLGI